MDHDHQDDHEIERWLNEGGVQLPTFVEMLDPRVLDEHERRVIACLGAAVVSVWHSMSTDARRVVLQAAVRNSTYDAKSLKGEVAAFLRGKGKSA
ncbi:hypothetical protein [Achromobacter animicus]|uniref:hypothetical protein n=1 Tax=Achromobacter animicus TaxID=1389935 RepID=UPI001583B132|nr:hypothetical protein [Achromobacter animicus]